MPSLKEALSDPTTQNEFLRLLSGDDKLAERVLHLALKARGYNNHQNDVVSGEAHFRELLIGRIGVEFCVDIGCNVGNYSRSLLDADASLEIMAFDPSPEVAPAMNALVAEYPGRIRFIPKGVSESNEIRRFHFDEKNSELGSFVEAVNEIPYVDNSSSIEVETVSLDAFLLDEQGIQKLDFIKIDTEGYEASVLRGAGRVIGELRPKAIQIEFNWHELFSGTTIFGLSQLLPDYRLFQLLPGKTVARNPSHPFSNFFQYSNFAFLRTDIVERLKKS